MTDIQLQQEAAETPSVIAHQLGANAAAVAALSDRLRDRPPPFIATSARGSSGHAATFAKYLFECHLGVVTAPLAPSIATIYGRQVHLEGALFVTISQSGSSPDVVQQAVAARRAGALTVAVVNDTASPLAEACEVVLPLHAGPETSVAATKSFIASLTVMAHLVAAWSGDQQLTDALAQLPDRLSQAIALDWAPLPVQLSTVTNMLTLGRGPGLAIAREAALKLKEVCGIHAEPYSAAEIMHGPITLVGPGYPILAFAQPDASQPALLQVLSDLRAKGAVVLTASHDAAVPGTQLPAPTPLHPALDLIPMLLSFYGSLVDLAAVRGTDPDNPRHLRKVTRTT